MGRVAGPADRLERDEAVERLRRLAAEDRLRTRSAQLLRLADDLAAETDLDRWAAIDLYAAFLRDDTVEERLRAAPRRWTGAVLDLLPAVLIFVPILLTWLGLYKATSAYRHSRGDADLAGKSFLEQWQTGFGGRLGEGFYFDHIALLTLLAIGILIVISLGQALYRRRADRQEALERTRLTRELATALTAADFHLSRFRMDDASRVDHAAQRLEDAAAEARKAGAVANDLQREAQLAMQQTRDGMRRVEQLAEALRQTDDAVRAAAERVGNATDGVGGRLAELSSATKAVADAAAGLTKSATADAERLRKAVAQAAAELSSAADADRDRLGTRIAAALDASSASIRAALDDWRTEGAMYSHRHETTAEHLGVIVGSIEQLMERTARALAALPSAVKDFEDHSRRSVRDLEHGMTAAITGMKAELDRLLAGLPSADGSEPVAAEFARLRRSVDALCDQIAQKGGRRRWFR